MSRRAQDMHATMHKNVILLLLKGHVELEGKLFGCAYRLLRSEQLQKQRNRVDGIDRSILMHHKSMKAIA